MDPGPNVCSPYLALGKLSLLSFDYLFAMSERKEVKLSSTSISNQHPPDPFPVPSVLPRHRAGRGRNDLVLVDELDPVLLLCWGVSQV